MKHLGSSSEIKLAALVIMASSMLISASAEHHAAAGYDGNEEVNNKVAGDVHGVALLASNKEQPYATEGGLRGVFYQGHGDEDGGFKTMATGSILDNSTGDGDFTQRLALEMKDNAQAPHQDSDLQDSEGQARMLLSGATLKDIPSSKSYDEAIDYCVSEGFDRLCTTDEYKTMVNCEQRSCQVDSWAPIDGVLNEYMQIGGNCHAWAGTTSNCYLHSDLNGHDTPSWAPAKTELGFRKKVCCYSDGDDGEGCDVATPTWVGDGYCDKSGGYNTKECGWDGGDCCEETCASSVHDCSVSMDCKDPLAGEDVIYEDVPALSELDGQKIMDWIKAEVTMLRLPFCWRDSYGRGVGTIPGRVADCPSGYTNNGATCGRGSDDTSAPSKVADCPSGYTNMGLTCHRPVSTYGKGCCCFFGSCCSNCRSGYTDNGCTCGRGSDDVGWGSFVCPSGYFKSDITQRCQKHCPAGYTNMGETCHRPASTLGMGSMTCRAGEERILARCFPIGKSCFNNEEEDAGLCYERCNGGYTGVGPVCWQDCDNSMVNCGAACGKTDAECGMAVAGMVVAPLIVAANIASLGVLSGPTAAAAAGAKSVTIGGKTFASTTRGGKAMLGMLKVMNNPNKLSAGAKIVTRTKHALYGTPTKVVQTYAKLIKLEYNTLTKFRHEFAEDFASETSPEINAELDSHFKEQPWVAEYFKGMWGMIMAKEMAEAQGIQIAQIALEAASIVDFTGVTGVVAAYAKPECDPVIPFPTCVTNENGCVN